LTHKAEKLGYHPEVILAGRRINDSMGAYIGQQTVKQLIRAGHNVAQSVVTVLGLTFKENCPDLRNSKVIDVIRELMSFGVQVQVADPEADSAEALHEYGIQLTAVADLKPAQALVVAVAHKEYAEWPAARFKELLTENPVVVDVKGICALEEFKQAGVNLWRL
jgi:UDP-N-acetyl-D-galactosamine dehydrogenase